MKPYRYLIYKLFSWGLKRKGDTPVANVILTLTVVHAMQLLTLYSISRSVWDYPNYLESINKLYVAIIFFLFAGLHYLLLYNKKRWAGYIEEFKNESSQQRKKGTVLVLLYLVGSILLFFALMPILFS
jgi:hypothetical protein